MKPELAKKALKGDRRGQHSIRVNEKWRIYFQWDDGNAYDELIELTTLGEGL